MDDLDDFVDVVADDQPFHATRADLLAQLGRSDEAVAVYGAALARTANAVERAFLEARRRELS